MSRDVRYKTAGTDTGGCTSCTENCQIVQLKLAFSQLFSFLLNSDIHLLINSFFHPLQEITWLSYSGLRHAVVCRKIIVKKKTKLLCGNAGNLLCEKDDFYP